MDNIGDIAYSSPSNGILNNDIKILEWRLHRVSSSGDRYYWELVSDTNVEIISDAYKYGITDKKSNAKYGEKLFKTKEEAISSTILKNKMMAIHDYMNHEFHIHDIVEHMVSRPYSDIDIIKPNTKSAIINIPVLLGNEYIEKGSEIHVGDQSDMIYKLPRYFCYNVKKNKMFMLNKEEFDYGN